jgi:histidine phosphatase superfamily protein (branch 1)
MNEPPHLRLLFETRATTIDNEAGLASGSIDVALSSAGRRAGARARRALSTRRPRGCVLSDLQRSFRTAEIPFARPRRLSFCRAGSPVYVLQRRLRALAVFGCGGMFTYVSPIGERGVCSPSERDGQPQLPFVRRNRRAGPKDSGGSHGKCPQA